MNLICKILGLLFLSFPVAAADLYGQLGIEYNQFFQDIEGRNGSRPIYKGSVTFKADINDKWTVKANPIVWADPESKAPGQRTFYDTHEGYVEFYKNVFSFRLGFQQFNWGVTESFDPAAVIHSYVLWDPLTWQPLAAAALNAQWSWSNSSFTMLVIPQKRSSQLPQGRSRWLPDEIINVESAGGDALLVFPDQPTYAYRPGEELDRARQTNFGLRYAETLSSVDYSLFYFEGAAPVPYTEINISGAVTSIVNGRTVAIVNQEIGLRPIDYRQRTVGGTFVYSHDDFIFRYAGNYVHTISRDPVLPPWTQANVVGLETSWAGGKLQSIIEYSHIDRGGQLNSTVTDINRLFDRALTVALLYEWSETWNISGSYLYDTKNFDEVFQASISGKVAQDAKLSLNWTDIVPSSVFSPLGSYNRNDRAQVVLEVFF